MDGAINLQRQAQFRAVEVDNEATDDLLPAELQAQTAAIAQHFPGRCFGFGSALPQFARQLRFQGIDRRITHDGSVAWLVLRGFLTPPSPLSTCGGEGGEGSLLPPLQQSWRGGLGGGEGGEGSLLPPLQRSWRGGLGG